MAFTNNFHPAHESYQTRLDFDCKKLNWYISSAQLATEQWFPKTIMDCVGKTALKPLDKIMERIGIEGHLVYYNPGNLDGYFPEELFDGKQVGDWNIPFIMRVLFLENWEIFLNHLRHSSLSHAETAECSVCGETCFNLNDPDSYGLFLDPKPSSQGFFMCNNSTKDNYHVTCHDCFQTLMIDRGLRFTKNPTCPCCRSEPSVWLGFTRHPEVDANEYPLMWLRAFYQQVRAQIFLSDANTYQSQYELLRDRYNTRKEQRKKLEDELDKCKYVLSEREKEIEHWKTKYTMSNFSELGWKKKYSDTRDSWFESFEEIERLKKQLLAYQVKEASQGPPVPSILGRRSKSKGSNVRLTIKKKFKSVEEEEEKEDK